MNNPVRCEDVHENRMDIEIEIRSSQTESNANLLRQVWSMVGLEKGRDRTMMNDSANRPEPRQSMIFKDLLDQPFRWISMIFW